MYNLSVTEAIKVLTTYKNLLTEDERTLLESFNTYEDRKCINCVNMVAGICPIFCQVNTSTYNCNKWETKNDNT
jgi:hypothetical protein